MSRGLTDSPEEQPEGPSLKDMDEALRELYAFTGNLGVRLEQLEQLMASAIRLNSPEEEAADRKTLRGL